MILVIDNYDSFVYNLVQYIGEINKKIIVYRNDKISIDEIKHINPIKIILSPGPGRPEKAGICCEIIKEFSGKIPILGVCLGHQCIGYAMGSKVVEAKNIMHGKTSLIFHKKDGLFKGIDLPFQAIRYHSLIIDKNSLSSSLEITAWTKEDEIMGIKHKDYAVYGVQFHPESILTKFGKNIINNFLNVKNI